jgi:HSP20 family protein
MLAFPALPSKGFQPRVPQGIKIFYLSKRLPDRRFYFSLKKKIMNYHQSWAAKGQPRGSHRHLHTRSMERAAVNIYKTENSFEILVFAPGRIRENFQLEVKGTELIVSYTPPEGFQRPDWIRREYSRGGFVRSFTIDDTIDTVKISAKYADGVLQISLPQIPGKIAQQQKVPID